MKFCVINISDPKNPNVRSKEISYNFNGYSSYEDGKWRSWHSIAACMDSDFFVYDHKDFSKYFQYDCILLLVNKEFDEVLPLVKKLKLLKKKVAVAYHEGSHLMENLKNFREIDDLRTLAQHCDFFWNSNPPAEHLWNFLGVRVESIPTCAPYDKWQAPASGEARDGIVVLTRTMDQRRLKRNTFLALNIACKIAKEFETFVSYVNEDNAGDAKRVIDVFFGDIVKIHKRKEGYLEWLAFLASHKVAMQMDNSHSHGQVITDCAFVDLPVFGGNCDNSRHVDVSYNWPEGSSIYGMKPAVSSDSRSVYSEARCLYSAKNADFCRLKGNLSFENTKRQIIEAFNK